MGAYNVHGGHSLICRGASGILDEVNEDRKVKNKVIELLRNEGHTVYDCTDDNGKTQQQNLSNIVRKCNSHLVNLDVSIHLNSGRNDYTGDDSTGGVEVWNYDSRTAAISDRICQNIANELGLRNRGTKYLKNLYVLKNTKSLAILVECCFVDDKDDANCWDADKCAKAIVEGILNKSISSSSSSSSSGSTTKNLYRVRKSWDDAKSQLGAYASFDNAKKSCPSGYNVYDWNGNVVYSNTPVASSTKLYRVRLTWEDVKSQKGAYRNLDNAKKTCDENPGYSVFGEDGNVVYSSKAASEPSKPTEPPKEDKPEEVKPLEPELPKYEDISPLKGFTHEQFLEYVGGRAREDMKKTGVLASVTIAQAILESAWGQSELSIKANNLFGMKATLSGNTWYSEWDGKVYSKYSNEEYNGVVTSVKSDFRLYVSVEASLKDHSDYLCGAMKGSELRYAGLKGEMNYRTAIQIIKDGGYATDSGYVDKICRIIEKYNLDKYDKDEEKKDDTTVVPDADNKNNLSGKVDSIISLLEMILKAISNGFELIQKLFKK